MKFHAGQVIFDLDEVLILEKVYSPPQLRIFFKGGHKTTLCYSTVPECDDAFELIKEQLISVSKDEA